MPSLENRPDNAVDQLVAKIEKLIAERRRLNRLLAANDEMTHYFEGTSSLGLFINMRNYSSQILQIGSEITNEINCLRQVDPKHPLIKLCKKEGKEVA